MSRFAWRLAAALAALFASSAPMFAAQAAAPAATAVGASAPAAAAAPPQRLRVVGGLAGLNAYTRHEEPFWTRDLPRLSGGRLSAEIVASDRAGIQQQEMLRLVDAGAVPFGTMLLAPSAAQEPELAAPDLAGLNPDIDSARRSAVAFRPSLSRLLRDRHDIELLAVYAYPAQVLFCRRELKNLAGLAGRRVRVSSATQFDFVAALGATPVQMPFAEIMANTRSGNIDCAVTGTMSGNTLGLHEATTHLHTLAISWGLGVFVANGTAWRALDLASRDLLRRELAKLELAIWDEAAAETGAGIACNTGADSCTGGRKGQMVAVRTSADDARLGREIFARNVLPAWLKRCGPRCGALWQQTLGPALGVPLP